MSCVDYYTEDNYHTSPYMFQTQRHPKLIQNFHLIDMEDLQEEKIICIFFEKNLSGNSSCHNVVIPAYAFYSRCSGHDSHPFDISIDGCSDELKANKTKICNLSLFFLYRFFCSYIILQRNEATSSLEVDRGTGFFSTFLYIQIWYDSLEKLTKTPSLCQLCHPAKRSVVCMM